MSTGLILLMIGVSMVLYTYISYRRSSNSLAGIREEDLVSYYLDLATDMLPLPLWIGLIGVVLVITGIIVVLINIPWTL